MTLRSTYSLTPVVQARAALAFHVSLEEKREAESHRIRLFVLGFAPCFPKRFGNRARVALRIGPRS